MTSTTTYPVMEAFATVQGEGAHTGTPSWFIRLGGCDVGCVWCDVKESWDPEAHPRVAVEDIVAAAVESGRKTVVVTGGEPAMHNLAPLTDALRAAGLTAHIETSGAHDQILKVLAPLNISDADLDAGLEILSNCVAEAAERQALGSAA